MANEYIIVRRRLFPRLLCLFFVFLAYNSLRLGWVSGSPVRGFLFALVFLAIAFPRQAALLMGMLVGWIGSLVGTYIGRRRPLLRLRSRGGYW